MSDFSALIGRIDSLLDKVQGKWLSPLPATDWTALAWRWQASPAGGQLQALQHPHLIALESLQHVDLQKAEIMRNTEQFVHGYPANNVLLTGARGTGKSSLVKALLGRFAPQGLRVVEVDKQDLTDLPAIMECLRGRPERFIVFCDDLSFEADEPGYKALKVVLDGSLASSSDNVLVYATSNRRHLMPEYMADNLELQRQSGEIRPGETVEEKIALSDRFGIWLSFYAFDQDAYLAVAAEWLRHYGIREFNDEVRRAALQWALTRGSRSGRSAYQFARDYAGRVGFAAAQKSAGSPAA